MLYVLVHSALQADQDPTQSTLGTVGCCVGGCVGVGVGGAVGGVGGEGTGGLVGAGVVGGKVGVGVGSIVGGAVGAAVHPPSPGAHCSTTSVARSHSSPNTRWIFAHDTPHSVNSS